MVGENVGGLVACEMGDAGDSVTGARVTGANVSLFIASVVGEVVGYVVGLNVGSVVGSPLLGLEEPGAIVTGASAFGARVTGDTGAEVIGALEMTTDGVLFVGDVVGKTVGSPMSSSPAGALVIGARVIGARVSDTVVTGDPKECRELC